jgi:RNA polymerase sigma factor (sigma-70 family)
MSDNPLGQVVRHLRRAAGTPTAAASEDRQLLEQFLSRHDEAAFAVLVRRYGPMVLGVCRRLLRNPDDAEDAFQVVFLVLVRKAHALGNRDLLANWLYGVAYRTALKARAQRARRQTRERAVAELPGTGTAEDAAADLREVLDEEVRRLPEKYRLPIVLCYLQGATLAEAARELGWPAGTVSGRLARARDLLRARLTRRGLAPTAALAEAVLSQPAPAAMPTSLVQATLRSALALAAGPGHAGGTLSAPVATLLKGVLDAMFVTKLKLAALVVLTFAATGAGTWALAQSNRTAPPHREVAGPPPAPPAAAREDPPEVPPKDVPAMDATRVKELLDAMKASDKLKALLKEQHEQALTCYTSRWEEFLAGRGTLDIMLQASRLLLEAEQALSDKKADQVTALENHWRRMKVTEDVNQARFDAGRLPISDLAQTKFYRLQAEIALERARAK